MNLGLIIKRTMLFIGGTKDYVNLIPSYKGPSQYIPDLETVALETGH